MFTAYPRQTHEADGTPFIPINKLPAYFAQEDLPPFPAVVEFQQELAGQVFYNGVYEVTLWGIQGSGGNPLRGPEIWTDGRFREECVVVTSANTGGYWIREDGRIEDGDWDGIQRQYAHSARTVVEAQALLYAWDMDVRPHTPAYWLRLPTRPLNDHMYWSLLSEAVAAVGLTRVDAASDECQQWFTGSTSLMHIRRWGDTVALEAAGPVFPAHALLDFTVEEQARAVHGHLAAQYGWGELVWENRAPRPKTAPLGEFFWLLKE